MILAATFWRLRSRLQWMQGKEGERLPAYGPGCDFLEADTMLAVDTGRKGEEVTAHTAAPTLTAGARSECADASTDGPLPPAPVPVVDLVSSLPGSSLPGAVAPTPAATDAAAAAAPPPSPGVVHATPSATAVTARPTAAAAAPPPGVAHAAAAAPPPPRCSLVRPGEHGTTVSGTTLRTDPS